VTSVSDAAGLSRRERLRAATVDEILATARRLLVTDGPAAVTLRAISREMGMTAPALYRYYDSLDALMEALSIALYDECTAHLEASIAEVTPDDIGHRLAISARAFRTWSIAHPAEFTLMFASTAKTDLASCPLQEAGWRFASVFLRLFVDLWLRAPFPVTPDEQLAPALVTQFTAFVEKSGAPLPAGAVFAFTSCWIRLYGMVALEVFGHLYLTLEGEGEAMFEAELAIVAAQLGLPAPPP
jgi:AcrR family transcriptional regulator